MLHAIDAAYRQQQMQADARQARLGAQLNASAKCRSSNRRQLITLDLAEAARTPLSSGAVLAWGYLLKGARLAR